MDSKEILATKILQFADGAAKGNPGPGGWGVVIATPDGKVVERGGGAELTTNNQMEMLAVIEGLIFLRRTAGDLAVLSDSVYVLRGISSWIFGWMRRGWTNVKGEPVANVELWQQMWELVRERKTMGAISWHYLRGHSGIPGNERVDAIADGFARKERPVLYSGSLLQYGHAIYDLPEDTSIPETDYSKMNEKPKAAYSYLSLVDGQLMIHHSWPECEARVKGRSGAKFKKALTAEEEQEIMTAWGMR